LLKPGDPVIVVTGTGERHTIPFSTGAVKELRGNLLSDTKTWSIVKIHSSMAEKYIRTFSDDALMLVEWPLSLTKGLGIGNGTE
jgi:hypothetical protein